MRFGGNSDVFWYLFWYLLESIFGTPGLDFRAWRPMRLPKGSQEAPKSLQKAPKRLQKAPKRIPRPSQEAQRELQRTPESSPDAPKSPQEPPYRVKGLPRSFKRLPSASPDWFLKVQKASKSFPGTILVSQTGLRHRLDEIWIGL